MRILVLGGTGWLGGTIAALAVERGHEVICVSRGTSAPPAGARGVVADRGQPGAYDAVAGEHWDAVVDIATQPGQVRSAVAALAGSADGYLFVSTASVYAANDVPGADESAELLAALEADTMASLEEYGNAKVACEEAVTAAFGPERRLVARPGLIAGPGDRSGRSGYWPWRFAHPAATDGSVLVPADDEQLAAMIDVRDLAGWLVRSAEAGTTGVLNAQANARTLGEHLATARQVAGHTGPLVAVTDGWLAERGVNEWMGPRSLPLWIADPEWRGFGARSTAAAEAAGLTTRPLEATLADTLAWEESQEHPHGAGLADDEERELLAQTG